MFHTLPGAELSIKFFTCKGNPNVFIFNTLEDFNANKNIQVNYKTGDFYYEYSDKAQTTELYLRIENSEQEKDIEESLIKIKYVD